MWSVSRWRCVSNCTSHVNRAFSTRPSLHNVNAKNVYEHLPFLAHLDVEDLDYTKENFTQAMAIRKSISLDPWLDHPELTAEQLKQVDRDLARILSKWCQDCQPMKIALDTDPEVLENFAAVCGLLRPNTQGCACTQHTSYQPTRSDPPYFRNVPWFSTKRATLPSRGLFEARRRLR